MARCRHDKYRFIGRVGDNYVWQRPMEGDSRVDQIMCNVNWFWNRSTE